MVNNADVQAFLLRLNGELQATGSKGSAEASGQTGMSFAASLGAELDAAASGLSTVVTEKLLHAAKAPESAKPAKSMPEGKAGDTTEVVFGEAGDSDEKAPEISPQMPIVQAPDTGDGKGQLKLPVHAKGVEMRPVVAKAPEERDAKPEETAKPAGLESGARPQKTHAEKHDAAGDEAVAAVRAAPAAVQPAETVGVEVLPSPVSMQQREQAGVKEGGNGAQGPELSSGRASAPAGRKDVAIRPVVTGQTEVVRPRAGAAALRGETSKADAATIDAAKADAAKDDESPRAGLADGHEEFQAQARVAGVADHTTAALGTNVVAAAAAAPPQHAAVSSNALPVPATAMKDTDAGVRGQLELRSNEAPAADRTIVATPSTLEVGIANGSHGWLKIRAELTDAGTVTAALSSTTDAGTQVLHRDLPALSSFLDREQVPVSSLVIHQADSSGFFAGADGSGGGAGGQQSQQGNADQRAPQPLLDTEIGGFPDGLPEAPSGDGYSAGGGWLSVRA